MGLKDLKNHYPIVFIGSGISKRYLANFPSWTELLEEYWTQLDISSDLYSFLHDHNLKDSNLSVQQQDYNANLAAATFIQTEYDKEFFSDRITLEGLTKKDAQSKRISPFKWALAKRFSKFSLRNDISQEELAKFTQMITKSKMIITTNYDNFIENRYRAATSKSPKIYVGQNGLFDESTGWAEIYKIHGSINNPNSIIINESDYQGYDSKSILITAKILSSMIDYPIIFFGYSMTDLEIRRLLTDFANQLPTEDIRKTANRIFVVQYDENATEISEEIVKDPNLNLDYTLITARDFSPIYSQIYSINEGLTPLEIQKYSSAIKELIISQGNKGALNSVLLSPTDLDAVIDQIHSDVPMVIAIGNTKNIYVSPNAISYITDYVTQKFELQPAAALRFVAGEQSNGRYPLLHYLNEFDLDNPQNGLEPFEIKRLKERRSGTDFILSELAKKVPQSGPHRCKFSSIAEINDLYANGMKYRDVINSILFNVEHLDFKELNQFVVDNALPRFVDMYRARDNNQALEKSALRKLFVAWDILKFGRKKS